MGVDGFDIILTEFEDESLNLKYINIDYKGYIYIYIYLNYNIVNR